jgi:hypothetical protein
VPGFARSGTVAFALEHSATEARGQGLRRAGPPVDITVMTALDPLRIPAFRRLAATYTLDELGFSFGTVSLAILVFAKTGSALATTALFLASTFVPALVAPALTARLDRLPVRRALPGLYLVERVRGRQAAEGGNA